MPATKTTRRGHREDSIFFSADRDRWIGEISAGFRADGRRFRRKVTGRTKQEVRDKLKAAHSELDAGLKTPTTYTVRQTVEAWLRDGLDGKSERTKKLYAGLLGPLMDEIGRRQLRQLSAGDVRNGLAELTERYSTRSCRSRGTRLSGLSRTPRPMIWWGEMSQALIKAPRGRAGRPSKSFTVEEAQAVLAAAAGDAA